jgi:hypothetical protein
VFRTPGQRYLISPVLLQLFEAVTHTQLPRRLIALLSDAPHTPVQLRTRAVHALGLYARGPRIAHTPPSSHWHSNAFLAKRVIVEAGGLPPLLALLSTPDAATSSSSSSSSSSEGLRARALQALTALGEDNSEAVQLLHSSGFGAALVAVLVPASSGITPQQQQQLTVAEARAAAQAFAVMCGHTHSEPGTGLAGRSQSELAPVAAVIAHLLGTAQDWCVLSYICDALAQLLAAVPLCPLELLQAIAGSLERALSVPASSSGSSSSSSDDTSAKLRREAVTALCSCLHTAAAPHTASRTDVCTALLPLVCTALTDSALRGSSAAAADARSQAAALLQTLVTAHPSALTAAAVQRLAQPAIATIAEGDCPEEALSAVEQTVMIMSASAEAARVLHAHRIVPALFALLRTACCGSSDTMEQPECDEALAAAAAGALCTVLAAGAALAASSSSGSSSSSSGNPFIGDFDRSAIAALAEPLAAAVAARCTTAAAAVQRLAEAMLSAYAAAAAAAACDAPTAAAVRSAAQELTAVLEQAAAQHRALQAADAGAAGSTTPVRRAPFHAHDPSVSEQQQQQQQQHRRNDSYGDEYGLPSTASLFGNSSSSSSSAMNNSSSSSSSGYTAAFFAQHGSASPSTAPTSPPLHSGAAAAASSSDVNSAAVEVITTALNFEGSVRTVLPVGGHWDELLRELLRHCSVTVGRSVELLYLSADGRRHVPLCEQDDLRYILYLYTTY